MTLLEVLVHQRVLHFLPKGFERQCTTAVAERTLRAVCSGHSRHLATLSCHFNRNLLHASPSRTIYRLHEPTAQREDWASQFICLHKIKDLQRGKEEFWKWDCQEIWMRTQQRNICSRRVGENEHRDSSVSTQCLLHSQQHSNSYLILLSTNILLCFWICSTEREPELPSTAHTLFSKQSRMPNQQKALTLFSQVINWNGKPAYCDSITKELLHSGAAAIISINWLKRNQLRLYHNIQSCILPVFTGLPHT